MAAAKDKGSAKGVDETSNEVAKYSHGESFADGSVFEEGLGRVSNLDVEDEMNSSFLAYAMSVIVSRALPDARDGLKPVQRRILFSAYEMGLRPERTHVKSARIIGECFVAGALVSTPTGLRAIEDLSVGDDVDGGDGSVVKVVACYANPPSPVVRVGFSNGNYLTVTPGQLFRVVLDDYSVKWVRADELIGLGVSYIPGSDVFVQQDKMDRISPQVKRCNGVVALLESEGLGDVVLPNSLNFVNVTSLYESGNEATYDIQVDSDDHSFVVEGFVVHNCMGKLHPHGDSAIYEALVRMAQEWSLNLPLINPQGNFGSRDDGPAASRYTEARLSKPALDMVDEIDEDTVDFRSTYDDSGKEPTVLPAGFPNLLVNGTTGIAVGMATNMASHNLNEVVSVLRAMLADEEISDARLFEMIPAPDFPTGGVIVGIDGVREGFLTGRGAFKLRAVASITDVTARKKGIVVTELPYTIGPEKVIESIKDAVAAKRLLGISDVRDLSDRRTGLKLVIEAKAGYDPEALLAELWVSTPLQVSFSVNNVALVNGSPQTLGLRELCNVYLEHRIEVVSRRTGHRLKKASERAHIISGLVTALSSIERVVAIIRGSKDTEVARKSLMKELVLDEVQCAAILEMTLRRLTGLEVNKLKGELKELEVAIKHLGAILNSKKKLRELVSSELADVVARHGAPRRSKILEVDDTASRVGRSAGVGVAAGAKCALVLSNDGRLTRYMGDSAMSDLIAEAGSIKGGKSGRSGKASRAGVSQILSSSTASLLGAVTSSGRVIHFHCSDVPEVATATKSVLSMSAGEDLVAITPLDNGVLTLVTERGIIKRIKCSDLPRKSGGAVINLAERDHLISAFLGSEGGGGDVYIVSSDAQLLRTPLLAIRTTGASSAGIAGMKVDSEARVLLAFAGDGSELLVTVADSGRAKVTKSGEYPSKGRNGGGVRSHSFKKGESKLVAAGFIPDGMSGVATGSGGALWIDSGTLGKRDGAGDQMLDPGVKSIGYALK